MNQESAPIPNPFLKTQGGVDTVMTTVPAVIPSSNERQAQAQQPSEQNGTSSNLNTTTAQQSNALNLFAPAQGEFNEGAYDIDIDELFHDCYFEEYNPTVEEDHRIPSLPPPNSTNDKAMTLVDSGKALPDIISSTNNPLAVTNETIATMAIVPSASNNMILPQKRSNDEVSTDLPYVVQPQVIQSQPQSIPIATPFQQQQPVIPQAQYPYTTGSTHTSSFSSATCTAKLTEQQKLERRERNREHAKRSRLRKKFLLESLQEQIHGLQSDIEKLTGVIRKELPEKAEALLRDMQLCTDPNSGGPNGSQYKPVNMPSGFGPVKTLIEPDFRLMFSLSNSQQNFAISDPSLPDNPIIYVSQGFLDLTGYTLDQVLGRNCRFLQGPGTDQAAVEVIRKGMKEGVDTSVCLLNYKADGTPFWNQFFVAALRDANDNIVNYVGVQCEVSKAVVESHLEHLNGDVKAAVGTSPVDNGTLAGG